MLRLALVVDLAWLGFVLVSISLFPHLRSLISFLYSYITCIHLFPAHSLSLSLTHPAGKFRKQKVERAEPPEQLKEKYDGFLTPTEFKHHNYVEMER